MKTTLPASLPRIAMGALLILALASSAPAQSRHRIVKRPQAAAATLSGIVIDATSRAPLAEAFVRIAGKGVTTGSDGRFSFTDLVANAYELEVTRFGYFKSARNVSLNAGANQVEVALQATPIVTVRAKNGTTYSFDFESVEFGYVVAFVGWRSGPALHLCRTTGEELTLGTNEMKSLTIPGVRTETTSCCSLAPGTIARVTRQDSEVVEATIKETCNGAEFFVRGQNRSNGTFEAIKLLDVESITF